MRKMVKVLLNVSECEELKNYVERIPEAENEVLDFINVCIETFSDKMNTYLKRGKDISSLNYLFAVPCDEAVFHFMASPEGALFDGSSSMIKEQVISKWNSSIDV